MNKVLKIPEDNFANFEKRFKRLSNKSRKLELGLKPLTYKVLKEYVEDVTIEGNKYYINFKQVLITGDLPVIPNWSFVASIEHQESGDNLIFWMNDIQEEIYTLQKYYKAKPICQHCNTNRRRKHTVLVKHNQTGNIIQVGKSCLNYFLGNDGLSNYEYIKSVNEMSDFEEIDRPSKITHLPLETIVRLTIEHLRDNKFTSKKDAEMNCIPSTAYIIDDLYHKDTIIIHKDSYNKYLEIVKYFKNLDISNNDYMNNLRSLYQEKYFNIKYFGYIIASVNTYNRHLQKLEQNKNKVDESKSEYLDLELKTRHELELTYVSNYSYETEYGTSYIHKFLLGDNVVIWKTSKGLGLDKGDSVKVKATIKEYDEYRGIKQTYITRCTVL